MSRKRKERSLLDLLAATWTATTTLQEIDRLRDLKMEVDRRIYDKATKLRQERATAAKQERELVAQQDRKIAAQRARLGVRHEKLAIEP